MKKLLKLNQLRKADLNSREMFQIRGGRCCGCGCHGPSSTQDNSDANANGGTNGKKSIGGSEYCWCWNQEKGKWDSITAIN